MEQPRGIPATQTGQHQVPQAGVASRRRCSSSSSERWQWQWLWLTASRWMAYMSVCTMFGCDMSMLQKRQARCGAAGMPALTPLAPVHASDALDLAVLAPTPAHSRLTHSPQQRLQQGPCVGAVCHVTPLIHPAVQDLQAHKPGGQGSQAGRAGKAAQRAVES